MLHTPGTTAIRRGAEGLPGATVAEVMVRHPKVGPTGLSVSRVWEAFRDDHVHAVLVVTAGRLLSVVERPDLDGAAADDRAAPYGRLAGRTVAPDADLPTTWRDMTVLGRRRLAVVDGQGHLLGLLCLKRSGRGFCSQAGVDARSCATEFPTEDVERCRADSSSG